MSVFFGLPIEFTCAKRLGHNFRVQPQPADLCGEYVSKAKRKLGENQHPIEHLAL
jgi:hypothetical protein